MELDETWRDPERSETFGDGEANFARHSAVARLIARLEKSERRGFHLIGGGKYFFAFRRDPYAVNMTGEQCDAQRPFEFIHSAAHCIDGHLEMFSSSAEGTLSYNLQSNADSFPIRDRAPRSLHCLFRIRNTLFLYGLHTVTPSLGNF